MHLKLQELLDLIPSPEAVQLLLSPQPLIPRITKSTAVATIRARFENDGDLLARFEVAKNQANLWDGERDGLREAVKVITPGSYATATATVILTRTESAKVLYPNANGKHQLENCLQCSAPPLPADMSVAIYTGYLPADLLDHILHALQTSKQAALDFLTEHYHGSGITVDNSALYEKKGSEKSTIAVIPS